MAIDSDSFDLHNKRLNDLLNEARLSDDIGRFEELRREAYALQAKRSRRLGDNLMLYLLSCVEEARVSLWTLRRNYLWSILWSYYLGYYIPQLGLLCSR